MPAYLVKLASRGVGITKLGRLIMMGLVVIGVLGLPAQAFALPKVFINGQQIVFKSQEPQVKNGFLMVPVRELATKIKAQVGWDNKSQSIIISKGSTKLVMQIGKSRYYLNGKPQTISVAPIIYFGVSLVPLESVCKGLGIRLKTDASANRIYIFCDVPPQGFGWAGEWYNQTTKYYTAEQVGEVKQVTVVQGYPVWASSQVGPLLKFIKTSKGYLAYQKAMVKI